MSVCLHVWIRQCYRITIAWHHGDLVIEKGKKVTLLPHAVRVKHCLIERLWNHCVRFITAPIGSAFYTAHIHASVRREETFRVKIHMCTQSSESDQFLSYAVDNQRLTKGPPTRSVDWQGGGRDVAVAMTTGVYSAFLTIVLLAVSVSNALLADDNSWERFLLIRDIFCQQGTPMTDTEEAVIAQYIISI